MKLDFDPDADTRHILWRMFRSPELHAIAVAFIIATDFTARTELCSRVYETICSYLGGH